MASRIDASVSISPEGIVLCDVHECMSAPCAISYLNARSGGAPLKRLCRAQIRNEYFRIVRTLTSGDRTGLDDLKVLVELVIFPLWDD